MGRLHAGRAVPGDYGKSPADVPLRHLGRVKDGAADLPGIEHIPEADLLIVFARRLKLPPEQMQVIRRHWDSGKPIVGIRTASHAFSNEDNAVLDRQVLGGNYQGHCGDEPVVVGVAEDET
jgi:hypothetical protein